MAAYAALVSLMNNMQQIQNHPRLSTSLDKYQIESLEEKVGFFLDFIESYDSQADSREAEDLESQITSAAHAAEDVIEFRIVGQIRAGSYGKSHGFLLDLQKVIEDMDSVKEKVMKLKEERVFKDQQPKSPVPAASSRGLTTGKTTMVGFDGYLTQLLDGLTEQQSDRRVRTITGMGGVGKTTLARNVYENSLIVRHFDVRAWVTISQGYNVKEILSEVFSCLEGFISEKNGNTEDPLELQLYKFLSGRRYLVILDDMWDLEVWNKIKFSFPINDNGSRIIVTSRLSEVANHFGSELVMNFLDDDKSWELFCKKALPQEDCPPELEEIGKKIVKRCKGLPLSIVVIGGLLGRSRTPDYWKEIANDIISNLSSAEDNQCLNILSLSYSHLPAYLKPCFLYLGIFPEDQEMDISRVIKFWVAEGFIKPKKDQSLEEIAEGYMKDLFDRNLILVGSLRWNGKVKNFRIHDLLRDLCIRVAQKEKFLCRVHDIPQDLARERRIVIQGSVEQYFLPRVRTLLYRSVLLSCEPRLMLRVLAVDYENACDNSLDLAFQQVNMRFLACESIWEVRYVFKLPSSISLLWNLQTLIITEEVRAPSEIWKMRQLRHLEIYTVYLPDPPSSGETDDFALQNLQTLKDVCGWRLCGWRCSEEVLKRIPNVKELQLTYPTYPEFFDDFDEDEALSSSSYEDEALSSSSYEDEALSSSSYEDEALSSYFLCNVGCLNKLESLRYNFLERPDREELLQNLKFPSSLKELTLIHCGLHWEDLTIIGSLPHLGFLQLDGIRGKEWNPITGEFLHLKFLEIDCCYDLTKWNADSSHFPVLENLSLSSMRRLREIPSYIGNISTLKDIRVSLCSISAGISAMKILQEQEEDYGNKELHIRVRFRPEAEREKFMEKVKLEGFTCKNFQII